MDDRLIDIEIEPDTVCAACQRNITLGRGFYVKGGDDQLRHEYCAVDYLAELEARRE